ncbi:MAG: type II toxin-antitoxin system TacA family antitoxin [Nitrospiraceae bacterium]
MAARTLRTEKLDLRLSRETKRTLEIAASVSNRSLTAFVLESALARADEMLADRRAFVLSKPKWTAFLAALDAPTRPLPRMQRLLTEPGFFDSEPATNTEDR